MINRFFLCIMVTINVYNNLVYNKIKNKSVYYILQFYFGNI
jgi:hypothetical protein